MEDTRREVSGLCKCAGPCTWAPAVFLTFDPRNEGYLLQSTLSSLSMVPNSGQWGHCQRSMIAKWVIRTVCTSFSPSRRLRLLSYAHMLPLFHLLHPPSRLPCDALILCLPFRKFWTAQFPGPLHGGGKCGIVLHGSSRLLPFSFTTLLP